MATVMKAAKMWTTKWRTRRGRTRTKELERISKMRNSLRALAESESLKSIQKKHFLSERRELEEKSTDTPDGRKELGKKASALFPHSPFIKAD